MGITSSKEFCAELRQRIEEAYTKNGNNLGWRLLYSPDSVLTETKVVFIGLNPGGSIECTDHAEFSMSAGSAYVTETWENAQGPGESPLQVQVCKLFKRVSVEPDQVLAGNLVPFRSPDWKHLQNRHESLQFGERLWDDILKRVHPSLVIGMGKDLRKPLSRILGARDCKAIPVGWGKVTATSASLPNGRLVILPHLSRFRIMTKPESQNALKTLFGDFWKD